MNSITVKNQYQLTKWAAIIKEYNDNGIKINDWPKPMTYLRTSIIIGDASFKSMRLMLLRTPGLSSSLLVSAF